MRGPYSAAICSPSENPERPSADISARSSWRAATCCSDMATGRMAAEREQLAVDHPVAQARPDAEADLAGQRLDPLLQPLAVAGLGGREAIAQHYPVDLLAILHGAGFAAVPDRLGIEAVAL